MTLNFFDVCFVSYKLVIYLFLLCDDISTTCHAASYGNGSAKHDSNMQKAVSVVLNHHWLSFAMSAVILL